MLQNLNLEMLNLRIATPKLNKMSHHQFLKNLMYLKSHLSLMYLKSHLSLMYLKSHLSLRNLMSQMYLSCHLYLKCR
jgi:hypothetical protein